MHKTDHVIDKIVDTVVLESLNNIKQKPNTWSYHNDYLHYINNIKPDNLLSLIHVTKPIDHDEFTHTNLVGLVDRG